MEQQKEAVKKLEAPCFCVTTPPKF